MIAAKKTDDKNVYLKLSLSEENSLFLDGYLKSETVLLFPTKTKTLTVHGEGSKPRDTFRHPTHNATIARIFNAISDGNCDEVDLSLNFVTFKDCYHQGQTAAITSLFCKNYIKRRSMIQTLMKWKMNFKLPDLEFMRDPIHWCCILNYKHEFKMIIDYLNFDIDYQMKDVDANTYLHLAVMSNSLSIVKILLSKMTENKIKADQSNLLGFSPYILSRKCGHKEISSYLESTSIISTCVCDNLLHRSTKEWSVLGKFGDRKKKFGHNSKMTTFQIPEIENRMNTFKRTVDLNKVIHSAYVMWTGQHVESFRKLAVVKDFRVKKLMPPIAATNKKIKVR